jgi:hypothetical protein
MAINKIDSNIVGLAIAEEQELKVLPVTPVWYEQLPNSYSDFGGEITTVARNPINAARQRRKGVVTDLEASGGYTTDVTMNNMARMMQGFMFADAREKQSTKKLNTPQVLVSSVTAATKVYALGSSLSFTIGQLVHCDGFINSSNNGLKSVSAVTTNSITVTETLVNETPTSSASITVVGVKGASADLNIVVTAGIPSLTSTTLNFTTLGLIVGEWIFIGGDTTDTRFANNVGYARIKTISANAMTFDDTTFSPVSETGTAKTIHLFFGTVIKNEDTTSLIKRRSYQLERQIGLDSVGMQSEYIVGAICNEMTMNIPTAEKMTADLSFIAINNEQRTGTQGLKSGTRVADNSGGAINTSSDIYRLKMNIHDYTSSNPTALFGYVSEANITINNNASGNKAVGVLGSFDITVGDFEVGGSITAYFTNVASVQAVRNNADVNFNAIVAQGNKGFIYDMPLISLGGGRLNVEKDSPITVPLENMAVKNSNGYTLLTNYYNYLPTIAMP